jgi:hypothetical protein
MRFSKPSCLKFSLSAIFALLNFFSFVMAEEVTVFNYVNAKTSLHFDRVLSKGNNFNQWSHNRQPIKIEAKPQSSRRVNRDTLYSYAVVNISEGASFYLPESNGRYLSVQVINEGHFNNRNYHEAGEHALTMEEFDSKYVVLIARVLADPSDPKDLQAAHAIQNLLKVKSSSDVPYSHPVYDEMSMNSVSQALLSLATAIPNANECFGRKEQVDPIRHLLATAYGWGGLPEEEAMYLNVQPKLPIGAYSLTVKDVPVNGFWSISVYNKDGFFEKNSQDIYSVNNLSAEPNADGSYTVHFGGDSKEKNFLPITEGWNYVIRMYRPKPEIVDGTWRFPEAK